MLRPRAPHARWRREYLVPQVRAGFAAPRCAMRGASNPARWGTLHSVLPSTLGRLERLASIRARAGRLQLTQQIRNVYLKLVQQTVQVDRQHVGTAVFGARRAARVCRVPEPAIGGVVAGLTHAAVVLEGAVELGDEVARGERARPVARLERAPQLLPEPVEMAGLDLGRLPAPDAGVA